MRVSKVFLDTTVLKFSATALQRLLPRNISLNWGGKDIDVTVHDFVEVNPNDFIANAELKAEAELLPRLAELGKRGAIEYVINSETLHESWGLPNMDSKTGRFYGAPVTTVKAPLEYSRIVIGGEIELRPRRPLQIPPSVARSNSPSRRRQDGCVLLVG
jgi:hypothetical protein